MLRLESTLLHEATLSREKIEMKMNRRDFLKTRRSVLAM